MDIETIAAVLAEARQQGTKLKDYPSMESFQLTQGYEIQDAMARAISQPIVGWKVGMTSEVAQTKMGINEPLAGPLFANVVHNDDESMKVKEEDLRFVEAEIAFKLKTGLPPRSAAYERDEVISQIATVHPVFELVNKRLPGDMKESPEWIVADGCINGALVVGDGVPFAADMDMSSETVSVAVNDKAASQGVGSNAMGDPIGVVVWLANHLSDRGIGLKSGDVITTGLICDLLQGQSGDTFSAEYKTIGSVTMRLT